MWYERFNLFTPGVWLTTLQIYSLTFVKLAVTVFKYIPQIVSNHRRKSTQGWSITQVLLDLGGSIFSFLQLAIDSSLQADWTGLYGNPVKLGLANVSLLADLVFIMQHFVLYRHAAAEIDYTNEGELPTETDSLLHG
jgi:cystinosin